MSSARWAAGPSTPRCGACNLARVAAEWYRRLGAREGGAFVESGQLERCAHVIDAIVRRIEDALELRTAPGGGSRG